jgi:catechol 2,3-dioxygenase-like lactoylglutathione lyase family enzyme
MSDDIGRRLRGVSHLALNSSDMARTVEFFERLGIPLVKTMQMRNGGQHFFFDVGNNDCLAYFFFPDDVARPATEGQEMQDGAMNHVALDCAPEDIPLWWDRLVAAGIPFNFVTHGGRGWAGSPGSPPGDPDPNVWNDLTALDDDTVLRSFYFADPDGAQLEISAWYPAWDAYFDVDHEGMSSSNPQRQVDRTPQLLRGAGQRALQSVSEGTRTTSA